MTNAAEQDAPNEIPVIGNAASNEADANLFGEYLSLVSSAEQGVSEKTAKAFTTREVIIPTGAGESTQLTDRLTFSVSKRGEQSIEFSNARTGDRQSVTVAQDGTIHTSSNGAANFSVRRTPDGEVVTMPNGTQVNIERGRIASTETATGRIDLLTQEQVDARREAQQRERMWGAAEDIVSQMNQGSIPADMMREAYQRAMRGEFGREGVADLSDSINRYMARMGTASITTNNLPNGNLEVIITNPQTRDKTRLNVAPARR